MPDLQIHGKVFSTRQNRPHRSQVAGRETATPSGTPPTWFEVLTAGNNAQGLALLELTTLTPKLAADGISILASYLNCSGLQTSPNAGATTPLANGCLLLNIDSTNPVTASQVAAVCNDTNGNGAQLAFQQAGNFTFAFGQNGTSLIAYDAVNGQNIWVYDYSTEVFKTFLNTLDDGGGNMAVEGSFSSDAAALRTDGTGNLTAASLATEDASFSATDHVAIDAGEISSDGVGTWTVQFLRSQQNAILNGELNLTGLPTGTLASPPANLNIGDVWQDTTTSSTYPILRIRRV
jgi:hypothetical protein